MYWRLEKMFWVGVVSLIVTVTSIAIAQTPSASGTYGVVERSTASQKAEYAPGVWAGWVGKVEKSGSDYKLLVGEPTAHVYTLEGNSSEFEKFVGEMVKVQGDLSGTTLRATSIEPHAQKAS
jgi:hypothetical protein